MYFKCCIPYCASKREDTHLHKFPSDEDQRMKWLDSINSDTLKSVDSANLSKLLVCHKHFEKRFHTAKCGIKKTAYPTLFSPKEIEEGIASNSFNYDKEKDTKNDHTYARKRHYDHSYCKPLKTCSAILEHQDQEALEGERAYTSTPTRMCRKRSRLNEPHTNMASTSKCVMIKQQEVSKIGELTSSSTPKMMCRKRLVQKFQKLTPKCRLLYREYKKSKRQLSYNVRAKRAAVFSKKHNLEDMTNKMNPIAKKFLYMQIKMCTRSKKGRRFSLEEKLIALSILKQSPKAYKFLQKIFILPSNTTLKKMIAELDIKAGINTQIFEVIKEEVSGWDEKKKICTIMFDEMALETSLVYSEKSDGIHGFVELSEKSNNLADHALAFLVRGAVSKWQQPVAFYFTEGAISSQELQKILKVVTTAVIETGLNPIALVCDQGSSFQSALKNMQQTTRGDQIRAGIETDNTVQINGASLSIIYDPPHLIKGIRNNFITKDISNDGKISKWQDIVDVYETDCKHTQSRLLHKLNDEHVIPKKVKKMKVKNCVRVLSKTVAAALSYTAAFSHYADGRLVSKTLNNTAQTVSFLDDLFDSVNGSSLEHKQSKGKPLRKAVTAKSPHHEFWKKAKKTIQKIKFLDKGSEKSVPSLKNWITTIESYQRIWQVLKNKNIKVMRPRYFNSDPIENFFGRVRAYNFRNNDPTCQIFISTFKSLLITGFIKFHSETYNCEDDACNQLIKVQSLFRKQTDKCQEIKDVGCHEEGKINTESENIQVQAARERLNVHSRAYTAGWVTKKILSKILCQKCETNLCTNVDKNVHKWISHREYKTIKQKKLTYPSEHVVRHFGYIIEETNGYLENNAFRENISTVIKNHLRNKYPFDFFNCEKHREEVLEYFLKITIKLCIYNWCNIINKILKGTDLVRLQNHVLPTMQRKALMKYTKKLRNKSFNK